MIQTGLAKDLDGTWNVEQLREELQNIMQQYSNNFQGEIPVPSEGE